MKRVLIIILVLALLIPFISCGEELEVIPTPIIDSDGDGWTDAQEDTAGTNPHEVDTDGDGYWDPQDPNPLDVNLPEPQPTATPQPTVIATPQPTPTPNTELSCREMQQMVRDYWKSLANGYEGRLFRAKILDLYIWVPDEVICETDYAGGGWVVFYVPYSDIQGDPQLERTFQGPSYTYYTETGHGSSRYGPQCSGEPGCVDLGLVCLTEWRVTYDSRVEPFGSNAIRVDAELRR